MATSRATSWTWWLAVGGGIAAGVAIWHRSQQAKRDSTAAKASYAASTASAAPLPSTTRVTKTRRRHEAAAAELQGRIEYRERHAASAALCKLCASKDAAAPDLAAVRALVAGVDCAGADLRFFVDAHGFTSLIRAAQRGRGAIVAALLAADASSEHVRGATNRGSTGLIWASTEGHPGIVEALLAADPAPGHVRMANDDGYTALLYAAVKGRAGIVAALLAADPSPEHVRMAHTKGYTGLIYAAQEGHVAVARALLRADPAAGHVRMADARGFTGLISACWKGAYGEKGWRGRAGLWVG